MQHGSGVVSGAVGAGPFHVGVIHHRPGLRLGAHDHERACLHYVTRGVYRERTGAGELTVPRRGALFKPPGLRHWNDFAEGSVALRIDFPADAVDTRGRGLPGRPVTPGDARLERTALLILRELDLADDCTGMTVHGLCLQLLGDLLRGTARPRSGRGRPAPPMVLRCEEYLRAHFREPVCFTTLARRLGASRSHLARSFRRHHGATLGEFVRRLRVEHARRELERTPRPLAEIALAAGFADQSHMTRVFKAHTGSTPGAWRQAFQGVTPVQDRSPAAP